MKRFLSNFKFNRKTAAVAASGALVGAVLPFLLVVVVSIGVLFFVMIEVDE